MRKIKVLSINQACAECPFYVMFDDLHYDCIFKSVVEEEYNEEEERWQNPMIDVFNDVIPDKERYINSKLWEENCRGQYENCVFLQSMYDWTADEVEVANDNIENFDPYRKNDDVKPEAYKPSLENVKISIHKVPTPYRVKADMLVYPNNNLLEILDTDLQKMTQFKLQQQLDRVRDSGVPIKMGHVYNTDASNINTIPFKNVAHAVVGGAGGLTEEKVITAATTKSLILAESINCKSIVLMPMDLGTLNVYQGALAQISAVLAYFETNKESSIERIYFCVTTDEVLETFEEYYKRIFKKENPAKKAK